MQSKTKAWNEAYLVLIESKTKLSLVWLEKELSIFNFGIANDYESYEIGGEKCSALYGW